MAPLRACLATAVREGLLRSNPAREADLPHRPVREGAREEVRAMTREDLSLLLACFSECWRLFFWFLAATGLRVSEAIALQWQHLDLDGGQPHVNVRRALVKGRMGPPKSRYGHRNVPLDRALTDTLLVQRCVSEWSGSHDLVFPAANGSSLSPSNVRRRVLKPAAEAANLPWVGFHAFRHTCAWLLFAEGRNAVQVQRWLGHHSAAFTLATYIHLLDGDIGEPLSLGAASPTPIRTPGDSATPSLPRAA